MAGVAYFRKSTTKQEASIGEQRAWARKAAEREGVKIVREDQEFRQQAHRGSLADAFSRDQMGKLPGQCGHATNQLQTAVLHALLECRDGQAVSVLDAKDVLGGDVALRRRVAFLHSR